MEARRQGARASATQLSLADVAAGQLGMYSWVRRLTRNRIAQAYSIAP